MNKTYFAGLDVGSTTAKIAIIDKDFNTVYSVYRRHNTYIHQTVIEIFEEIREKLGDVPVALKVTGSAGMGLSEKFDIPFIQEVIASAEVVKKLYPKAKTLIDIGGEDSKMIFFHPNKAPDIRMNGNCAGGTGAFIDQMATLLNIKVEDFNELAEKYTKIYPIASRCGVFAKTDVQNLIAKKIPSADIAASVFNAVAMQVLNTLARGFEVEPKVILAGGPFSFLPELRNAFINTLKLNTEDVVVHQNPELLPAIGAAIDASKKTHSAKLSELVESIKTYSEPETVSSKGRLEPLFQTEEDYQNWQKTRKIVKIEETNLNDYPENVAFLGIDSGSTTTKIVVTGLNNELLFKFYSNNKAKTIETVYEGLKEFEDLCNKQNKQITILHSAVTGYGEDLVKAAYNLDYGIVETIAHTTAAKYFNPNVTFIMDIGGQDMKAIFIKGGIINRIELNESCSSGCGSFIETFGRTLGYKVADFAENACTANAPCDLGTRCTVFMNSKVKQALKENATVADISAGLSISVIKNAIFKVLKLRDYTELGNQIVVQGGTFRNNSVVRALEMLTGKSVTVCSIPELMGAFGAALAAKELYNKTKQASTFSLDNLEHSHNYTTKQLVCKGCENNCSITRFTFDGNRHFYSGNKCEKIYNNKGGIVDRQGENLFEYKFDLLFNRDTKAKIQTEYTKTIGIPRILNMFSNYPFWNTLLTESGFNIELSPLSTMDLYSRGQGTIMSDSICFPAKLAHGHIYELIDQKVDRIFFPFVLLEKQDYTKLNNSFNCPIVSSYSDVLKSSINPQEKYGIPIDSPTINFNNESLLKKACIAYLKKLGVKKSLAEKAIKKAILSQEEFHKAIKTKGAEIIKHAKDENRILTVIAGRPYHVDQLINHKMPQILRELGVDVITEDAVPNILQVEELKVLSQWAYPNKIYNAASWVATQNNLVQFVQINSFGCGPDAIAIDESNEILNTSGKNNTIIRVDEITSTGSIKLRLRSFIESLKMNTIEYYPKSKRHTTVNFSHNDTKKIILAPYFADIYSDLLPALFEKAGYNFVNLPKPDKESVNYGLKYANNEICYPATVVVGDIIKGLDSGNYDLNNVAVLITQTGGQCRASNYLSLIKKAMVSAGFENVPVLSLNAGDTENKQDAFKISWRRLLPYVFYSFLFTDSLNQMYNAIVVREKTEGDTMKILEKYISKAHHVIVNEKAGNLFNLLKEAVVDFNSIETVDKWIPKVGIVGEIYVKLNAFGHANIVNWLQRNGVEVVSPPLLDFFIQAFVNVDINRKQNLDTTKLATRGLLYFFERRVIRYMGKTNKIMSEFNYYKPLQSIRHSLSKAEEILNPANQCGEGWLIPAEIADFAELGINNVISVQPFGCIANQIISKGVEKRIKDLYPYMNLLFLDFDDGTSEVNILNRLYFMLKNLEEQEMHATASI